MSVPTSESRLPGIGNRGQLCRKRLRHKDRTRKKADAPQTPKSEETKRARQNASLAGFILAFPVFYF